MERFKLEIDLLPKGAWNNDFSTTLTKKDWDKIRNFCYQKAGGRCEICGERTNDLNAHEVWDFDTANKTQTLKNIIAICSKCHGVIHFKNSDRLGFGESAKHHFMKVNNCTEMDFANHLTHAVLQYEERNKIFRWKMIADLSKFACEDILFEQAHIPKIIDPYQATIWEKLNYSELKPLFKIVETNKHLIGPPRVVSIDVDNYQGKIFVVALFANKIDWFLDNEKIKTKYNVIGRFDTSLSVKNLDGHSLKFVLSNQYGFIISQDFLLEEWN